MSAEALAVVRRIYQAWDRQESARDFIAEDVEYVNPPYAVEPGTRYGRRSFAVIRETYADYELEVLRMVEAGQDEIVVLARYSGTGDASGVRVEGEQGFVWTVRDGLAVRFRWFGSQREALEAAGLPAADE